MSKRCPECNVELSIDDIEHGECIECGTEFDEDELLEQRDYELNDREGFFDDEDDEDD